MKFDTSIPIDEIQELVGIVKDGKLLENIPHSIKLGMWVGGSTIEVFFPTVETNALSGSLENQSIEELCETILQNAPTEDEVSTAAINPLLIIAIIRLVAKLIENFN